MRSPTPTRPAVGPPRPARRGEQFDPAHHGARILAFIACAAGRDAARGGRVKVCIVGHSAAGFGAGAVGGSERQSALLARELAARGTTWPTSSRAWPAANARSTACACAPPGTPTPASAFCAPRRTATRRLLGMLRGEAADVYYSRGAGYYTPFVVRAARTSAPRRCSPWPATRTSTRRPARCCSACAARAFQR